MRISVSNSGILQVLLTEARLTAANASAFKARLGEEIEGKYNRVVLDLSAVGFVDSSGLGALVGVLKKLGARGDMVVCGLQPSAEQMFALTRMDKVFRITKTADQAVSLLEQD